ncbi:PAS domain-containing protein [Pseudonocardia sp. T1-2H]|uniref:PAS domain-containing protein n=1 Tax=Pseudonocardia sp. T1-2H TaxID=3128899 RepID=UPI003100CBBF
MAGGEEAPPPEGSSGDSVLVWVQDFDGYTLSINAAHRAVLGWSLDELSAVPFWELVHPDDQQRLMEDRERLVLRGPGRMPARRVRMLCRDGTHRFIACGMRANPEEERIYLCGEDVTDHPPQVRGERFLVGSWDWDISRDFATWSEGMYEIYGLEPGTGHNLDIALQRIHEDDRAAVTEAIGWALAAKESYAASHRIVRPDGAVRWLYSTGRVFVGEDGEPARMRGLTWDVTDRWQSPPIG